jgi:uncharacterized membrane protein YfcA
MGDTFILIAAAGLLFAGIIKGATGIGNSSCALPFLTAALGLKTAMALVLFPAVASNLALLWSNGALMCALKRFWPLYAATLPGIACGAVLLMFVDKTLPAQVLGFLIAGYAIQAWLKPSFTIKPRIASAARASVGFVNGVLTGFTGSQVMPLMPYLLALNLDTQLFVQAMNVAVVISSMILGAALWATGALHAPDLALSAMAVAPALVGTWVGTRARQYIPAAHFRTIVLAVLFLIGASLLTHP